MRIYVDVDGTLLDGSLDNAFLDLLEREGREAALAWYSQVWCDSLQGLSENILLVREYQAQGHTLVLWTNRGPAQEAMTWSNLEKIGLAKDDFDEAYFFDGKKSAQIITSGVVIDNEARYAACCTDEAVFILV